jgi:hypothetical protein
MEIPGGGERDLMNTKNVADKNISTYMKTTPHSTNPN